MKSTQYKALRAHIINTSLYQPKPRTNWYKLVTTAMALTILAGVMVLIGMVHR